MLKLPLNDAYELLGMTKSALRSKGLRKTWPRQLETDGGPSNNHRYAYLVPESEEEALELEVDRYVDDTGLHFVDQEPEEDDFDYDDGFEATDSSFENYVIIGDTYVFNLPSKGNKPWPVKRDLVRRFVRAYSKDGSNSTLNELCRMFGWSRKTVKEMKEALGKTHDSLPFTDEDLRDTDEDKLVEDLVRLKEEKIHVRAERIDWKRTKDLADKARNWLEFVENSMSVIEVPPPPPMPSWKGNKGKLYKRVRLDNFSAVSHATDLHFGKNGWVNEIGEEFNRKVCEQRLMETTKRLIDRIYCWGDPSVAYIGVGGDWFHIDNQRYQTTRGTPQDADGTYMQIFTEGCALAYAHIEMWRQAVGEVKVACVPGNHDYLSTRMLVHWLQAKYQDVPDVTIDRHEQDRTYYKVGNTIVGLTHGDRIKDTKLGSVMAYEAKNIWSETEHRLWLTGHWHSQIVTEDFGVRVEHLPSLAGSDQWHKASGYVGNRKALFAHLIDHEEGIVSTVRAHPSKR